MFSFKDLLSWNKLNALFLFQHFFSKRHDWTLSWTWCIFCRLSINKDIFENIFIFIFFSTTLKRNHLTSSVVSPCPLSSLCRGTGPASLAPVSDISRSISYRPAWGRPRRTLFWGRAIYCSQSRRSGGRTKPCPEQWRCPPAPPRLLHWYWREFNNWAVTLCVSLLNLDDLCFS